MAKVIATIGGVALKPGVSANRRWYTPEIIAGAVTDVQKRLADGETVNLTRLDPELSQLTHHGAEDDSTRIVGRLTGMSLDEDGNARFTAAIADTPHGRTIASLLDTSDGQPAFLKGVSIRGYWTGTVRKVKGPDGQPAETASGISLAGLDYTKTPGVAGAQVDTFAWADREGRETRSSTTERVAIYESVQEARVTITEETGAPGTAAGRAALLELLMPPPHILENGTCVTCARLAEGGNAPGDGSKPYGDVQYADPGYQADKQKRYPVDTKAHVKAALAYLAQKVNAAKYTAAQLKRIKSRIMAAAKKFGITVSASAESAGWTFDAPLQVSEAVAEHYGDPTCSGSWSVRASNGPVDICLSSYSMDPEDLDVILRAAADAACKALAALDPDMDGDVDVPGVGDGSDPDDDAPGETAPDAPTDPAASPAAATTETEDPAMAETTTPAAGSTPATDQNAAIAQAVTAALAAQETARQERKAAKRAAREKAEADAAKAAQETAAAAQAAANTALGQGIPATAGATATETAEERMARLQALADRKFAEAAASEGLTASETDEQILDRLLEEKLVPLRQARAENGGVQRKGIAKLEALADNPTIGKQLQEASNEDLKFMAGAAFGPKGTRS